MKYKYLLLLGVSIISYSIFSTNVQASSADQMEEIPDNVTTTNNRRADDWFSKPDEVNAMEKASEVEKADREKKEKERFVKLLNDNGFEYTLDTKNAHWIPMPHSGNEYIADVWVRLVQTEKDKEYSYPQKYYLEHYYIRPKTQQIQFLCELEVTGRPENAIQERPYKNSNWENLVPGSIEDEIYHKVLQTMKKNHIGGNSSNGMSVRDAVEEYLRISL